MVMMMVVVVVGAVVMLPGEDRDSTYQLGGICGGERRGAVQLSMPCQATPLCTCLALPRSPPSPSSGPTWRAGACLPTSKIEWIPQRQSLRGLSLGCGPPSQLTPASNR